jgi:hypothetical protein
MRYTPQAVLVANIEEARYRVLAAEQRVLVEARYAVRNNQRSFLKVSLPAGATVWSAVVDGQPIRPGIAETTRCCCRSARGGRPTGTDIGGDARLSSPRRRGATGNASGRVAVGRSSDFAHRLAFLLSATFSGEP